ncbi:spore germination protein [Paenibacillus cremeus]|uniref:Spore germination protein n=1 Tax=Paenibacillus cremeus TaxID=2163881 RepID=A0A559K4C9_9BACL|nr:spore germination protein [Paenibacillus cremeus]TVY06950.1 spore germination protein [Paenibacillus cremeus]
MLLYIDGLADPDHVQHLSRMIQSLRIDAIYDINTLVQYIHPSPFSAIPQILTSMRPDLIASKLVDGKVIGVLDGSPHVFSTPTSFFEFFSSPDDHYQTWMVSFP